MADPRPFKWRYKITPELMQMNATATPQRWNFYFHACCAVCISGSTIVLPVGHGIVSLSDDTDRELVFFPAEQLELELVPGEIGRLERAGLADRFGSVR